MPATVEIHKDRWEIPVTLSNGTTYKVVAYLYHGGSLSNAPLQVALHGGTYDHRYWDFPTVGGRDYSYAAYMVQKGYAVLAPDALGTGESDQPDGDFLTLQEISSSVKQVVAAARSGANPSNQAFSKIAMIGHSFGAITAIHAKATGAAADLIVSTGMNHTPHQVPISLEFVMDALTKPYFTFPPELRTAIFYHQPNADPAVIAADNAMFSAGVVSRGIMLSAVLRLFDVTATLVGKVTGDVLVQLGENDPLFPASLDKSEAPYWTEAPRVKVRALPSVGHCFNTHLDHERGWERVHDFIQEHLVQASR